MKKSDTKRHVAVGLYLHYDNGDMININELSKPEYEEFLKEMNFLRKTYIELLCSIDKHLL
jgi:hypothetical protein